MQDLFVHNQRIESDYKSMLRLKGPVITWQGDPTPDATKHTYPSTYTVTYNILAPTIHGDRPQHIVLINCSALDYPRRSPQARFLSPVVKHPHFYDSGEICLGGFPLEESIAELCLRLARFLLFDPQLINHKSIASRPFYEWYQSHLKNLPLAHVTLPELEENRKFIRKQVRTHQPPTSTPTSTSTGMIITRRSLNNQ